MSTIIDWERIAKEVIAENEQLKLQLQNVSQREFKVGETIIFNYCECVIHELGDNWATIEKPNGDIRVVDLKDISHVG